jgi:hypothetical protein
MAKRTKRAYTITETDHAMVALMKLLIGSSIIENPAKRKGLDDALVYLRNEFLNKENKKTAAIIETVRRETTAATSEPALFNLLRKPAAGTA